MIEFVKTHLINAKAPKAKRSRKERTHEKFEDSLAESYCVNLITGINQDLLY